MNNSWLNKALLTGVVYFCCMAAAHFFGLKWPVLFVYYDTPFHAYQDKIIAFAVVTYACLFHVAARIRQAVPAALVSIWVTALGLSAVNLSSALASVLRPEQSTTPYCFQTAAIAGYALLLTVLYLREGSTKQTLPR